MSKKGLGVDLYQANKEMSARVVDFMTKKVWGITLSKRASVKIEELKASIKGLKNAEGSILGDQTESINKLEAQIVTLREKLSEQKKAEASFAWTDADNALYNEYKDAEDMLAVGRAICAWFDKYGLKVTPEIRLVREMTDAISGVRCATTTTIVRSDAKTLTAKRTKTDFLKVYYSRLNELMQMAGTISPAQIPEDIRDLYAIKKSSKKSN